MHHPRRVGAVIAGPIIAVAGIGDLGYSAVFALCAILTVVAVLILIAARWSSRRTPDGSGPRDARTAPAPAKPGPPKSGQSLEIQGYRRVWPA
ncbi:hypothetical protein [Microbacterium rhizosphaerae]|uniref:MFS transporter n=1 Tax=Microbacterium rhizosphaerae TaxID=1678237 RepID=A0ABZ0SNB4_9MICO|nr:hypothetical protein [Microbacterium rhizosphaerae]WPR89719.1 hypothetical protein SM116_00065 [Microbacterium rhizosphaerae]